MGIKNKNKNRKSFFVPTTIDGDKLRVFSSSTREGEKDLTVDHLIDYMRN